MRQSRPGEVQLALLAARVTSEGVLLLWIEARVLGPPAAGDLATGSGGGGDFRFSVEVSRGVLATPDPRADAWAGSASG